MADSTVIRPLDEGVMQNISLAAHVSRIVVLAGARQFDRFLMTNPEGGAPRAWGLERVCHEAVGASMTWVYDPATQRVRLYRSNLEDKLQTVLPVEVGAEKELPLLEALAAYSATAAMSPEQHLVFIVNAGLLFEEPATPRDGDFALVQAMEHFAREASRSHLLVLRVGRAGDAPQALLGSPLQKTISIPAASRDVRFAYVNKMSEALARACRVEGAALAQTVANVTEDWSLEQVDGLLQTAQRQALKQLQDVEELARAIRVGASTSPWAGDRIREAVSRAEEDLTGRVLGQPAAVKSVVTALRKAVTGLANAHQGQGAQAPRAVLFFAGPTGTGKTEMAKAISQLVFGEESLQRFDCGELRQEHAVARLIGAPPGYVGFDKGGELTEGIRAKPDSVVLFDEIEKAHPRLLDTLLGVLDDGRLTSGQGETAFFGQAVLIFTSNLGMYEEFQDVNGLLVRRPRFDYSTPFEVVEKGVREAIRDEFVSKLGRPELLGRLGGAEAIIVFDYLRDIPHVCRKFIRNIASNVKRLQGMELRVDDAVVESVTRATQARPDALVLGGRGVRSELDRQLTNPLSDWLFDPNNHGGVLNAGMDGQQVRFTVT